MTLHGSDLLLRATYLDTKLEHCAFCRTISEYNRLYILQHYPEVEPEKVLVLRLGVDVAERAALPVVGPKTKDTPSVLLAVGRLHPVKDHAFLLHACADLVARDVPFHCYIAGEGPEHSRLDSMIRALGLEGCVTLLGHVPPARRDSLYAMADAVVLTSRSEGIPVVLMEAMARGNIVLAPAITGIPELVIGGKTGFLYEPGSKDDFVAHLLLIRSLMGGPESVQQQFPDHSAIESLALERIRHAARVHVRQNFNRCKNLQLLADLFLQRIALQTESTPDESPLLQQI
jgi:glycosyltransferase involved in cell wall biosynthesis